MIRLGRGCWRVVALVVLARSLYANEPVAASAPNTVLLPPWIVEVEQDKPRWLYARFPGGELLSRTEHGLTEEFAEAVVRLEDIRRSIVPDELYLRTQGPQLIVLVPLHDLVTARDTVVKDMMEAERKKRLALGPSDSPVKVSFLPNLRLWDGDTELVFTVVSPAVFEPKRIRFTRDAVRFRLTSAAPPLPEWFMVAVDEFVQQAEITPSEIWGKPLLWGSPAATKLIRDGKAVPGLIPMGQVFNLNGQVRLDPAAGRKQLHLFLHWIFYDGTGRRRRALWELAAACRTTAISETLFEKHFNLSYEALTGTLQDHLRVAVSKRVYPAPVTRTRPNVEARAATDAEIARLKGEWERFEYRHVKNEHPQFAPDYLARARRTLNRGLKQYPGDAHLRAVRGLLECDAGNDELAKSDLEAAVAARIERPRIYGELVRLRREQAGVTWDAETTREALGLLTRAGSWAPPMPEIFREFAGVLERSAARPADDQVAFLAEGLRLFPHDTRLRALVRAVQAKHDVVLPRAR